jgi:hypothetical protein
MRALDLPSPAPLPAPPAWLVEEARVLEPPPADERRHLDREPAGLLLDRLLVHVARGRGALDVALGEALAALAAGDRALRLGYSGVGDYARERVDVAPRTAQAMVRPARALRERPLLRGAVVRGEVSARKAETILPLALGAGEAEWVERARADTVRALAAEVRARIGAAGEEDEAWERVEATLPAEGRAVVDRALALAGELLGAATPRWHRVEALCEEYLGAHAVDPREDDDDERGDVLPPAQAAELEAICEAEVERWAWLDAIHASGKGPWVVTPPDEAEPGGPGAVAAPVPESAGEPYVDVFRLDEDLRRLAAMRTGWDNLLGHLAMLLQGCGLWRDLGFASFAHYCSERLGMSGRAVMQRSALERRLHALPALREAMKAGRVSYEKARLVATIADEDSLPAWIAQAEKATCIALRRLVDAAEDAQMCARRELAWRVPSRVAGLLRAAFRAAREAEGRWLTAGEALVRVAAHFIATWEDAVPARRTRSARVRARDLDLCQVPGCCRAATHVHHIQARSAGGGDEEWNLVALCTAHHLHAVHAGYVKVRGRAPHGLVWELGRGWDGAPLEVFTPAA